jgi:glucan-binding YG repeat protein
LRAGLIQEKEEEERRKKRATKEKQKEEELKKESWKGLSERENKEKKEEVKRKELERKAVMAKKAAAGKRALNKRRRNEEQESTEHTEEQVQIQPEEEEVQIQPEEVGIQPEETVIHPKKKAKAKREVERKGKRKVQTASDKHGCAHTGLLALMALPKNYLKKYVKEGGWLHKQPCKDCAGQGIEDGNVLDMSSLLNIKGVNNEVGYYCNCGPTGYGMDEDDECKAAWTCDMVLCLECYSERKNKMDSEGGAKRTKRKRKRYDE